MAIIATQLTLGAALSDLKANAATGLEVVTVTEELPQCLSAEVSGRVELLRESPRLFLLFQEANVEEHIFWGCWIDRQPAEPINMGLGLPWKMLDREVVLLQRCRPAMEERRPG